jgi:hypothetical protein
MKKLILLFVVLFVSSNAFGADTKGSALDSATPVATDELYLIDNPGGTPSSKNATVQAVVDAGTLKDLVTTSPLTGGANDVLPGADADLTLAITVAKDIVTTAPLTVNAGANLDNVIIGTDADVTLAVSSATDTTEGVVELSTDAESVTGTSDAVVVTPGTLTARLAAPGEIGGTTPAAGNFTTIAASGTTTLGAAGGAGTLNIGPATAEDVVPTFVMRGDADADGSAYVQENLTLTLTPNATETAATWAFSTTQTTSGFTFDAPVDVDGAFTASTVASDGAVSGTTITGTGKLSTIVTTEQFRLGYDATNYLTATLADDGHTTIATVDPDGAEADINFNPDGNVGIKTADPSVELEVTGDIKASGSISGQAEVLTDTSGAITITVNAVNYGTDTGDADIPDGACDAAGDVGNWVVLISSVADTYSLTSDDASNQFIIAANAAALTAGDELDVDGTMVSVMCIAAELWKVTGYMGAIPTDGGEAD